MIVVALFLALAGVVTAAWEGSATQAVFISKETCEAYVAAGSDGTCDVNTNGCVHIQTTTKAVRHQDYVCSTAAATWLHALALPAGHPRRKNPPDPGQPDRLVAAHGRQ